MSDEAIDTIWLRKLSNVDDLSPEVVEAFADLDGDEAGVLARRAVEVLERDGSDPDVRDAVAFLLAQLACAVPDALRGLHGRLLDCDVFGHFSYPMGLDPAVVFQGADSATRDRLIERLVAGSDPAHPSRAAGARASIDSIAAALAWVDDERVWQTFSQWRALPPPWARRVRTSDFTGWLDWITQRAGWAIALDGQRRKLHHTACHRLTAAGDTAAVSVGGDVDRQACPWCPNPLTVMLDMALTDPRLAAYGWTGERLVIPTCELCLCHAVAKSVLYVEVDSTGAAAWSDINTAERDPLDEVLRDRIPHAVRGLGMATRSPLEPLAFAYDVEMTYVGGAPAWVQGPAYPRCPRCGEHMPFVGQVDTSVLAWGEGAIALFVDLDCGLAATNYQQT